MIELQDRERLNVTIFVMHVCENKIIFSNSWNFIFLSQLVSLLAGLSNVKDSFNSCRKMSNELQQFETLMGLLMDVNNEVRTQAEVYELFKIKRWLIILFCILRFCVTKGTLLKPILQWLGAYTWSISSKLSLPKVTAVSCSREKYEFDLRRKSAFKNDWINNTIFTFIFSLLKCALNRTCPICICILCTFN